MKRLATLLLAAGLVFGATQAAQAVEFKGSGIYQAAFTSSNDFTEDAPTSNFYAQQRVRLKLEMIASENLRGVFQIENNINWGRSASATYTGGGPGNLNGTIDTEAGGGQLGGDTINIKTKQAYLDWVIPSTNVNVRMGLQGFALPSMVAGSSILDDDASALVISKMFNENVSGSLFWVRAYDNTANSSDAVDLVGLTVPMMFNGFNITPWAMYGLIGSGATDSDGDALLLANGTDSSNAYWGGFSAELVAFDPFRVALDFNYGSINGETDADSTSGFMVATVAEYKFDMVTPGIVLWYGSDSSEGDTEGGYMPELSAAFGPTTYGFDGSYGLGGGDTVTQSGSGIGTFGVALQAADITFTEDLSHLVRVAYYTGTGDGFYEGPLSDEQSIIELNVDTTYMIYENLEFVLELAYMQADWDEAPGTDPRDDAYRIAATFGYSF